MLYPLSRAREIINGDVSKEVLNTYNIATRKTPDLMGVAVRINFDDKDDEAIITNMFIKSTEVLNYYANNPKREQIEVSLDKVFQLSLIHISEPTRPY